MATLAVQKSTQAGIAVTYAAAAAGGDQFPAAANRELRVKNGSGAGINVTIASQKPCNQGSTHNVVVAVAAGAEVAIGPLDPNRFADTNGFVQVTYSAAASVTVAVVEV